MPLLEAFCSSVSRSAMALQLYVPSVDSMLDQTTAFRRTQDILAAAIWSKPPPDVSWYISAPKIGGGVGRGVGVGGGVGPGVGVGWIAVCVAVAVAVDIAVDIAVTVAVGVIGSD